MMVLSVSTRCPEVVIVGTRYIYQTTTSPIYRWTKTQNAYEGVVHHTDEQLHKPHVACLLVPGSLDLTEAPSPKYVHAVC